MITFVSGRDSMISRHVTDLNGIGTFAFQWARENCATPADDGDISGGTSSTYTVTADDLNCLLVVRVTHTDGDSFVEVYQANAIDLTTADWQLSLSSDSVTEGDPGGSHRHAQHHERRDLHQPSGASLYFGTHSCALLDGGDELVGKEGVHTITVPAGSSSGSVLLIVRDNDYYTGDYFHPLARGWGLRRSRS